MTIIEKLKKYTDLDFFYHSEENLNRILDNANFPCSFAFLAKNANLVSDGIGTRKQLNVLIFFVDKTFLDFEANENQEIIEAMEKEANKFLENLKNDNKFYLITNYGLRYVYDYFDVNVTGCALNLLIEETNCFAK